VHEREHDDDMMHDSAEPSSAGRPRCEIAKHSILDAVWRLLKKMPLAEISIEGIAREAGVGKSTIYRWWTSKAAVAMDAFLVRYLPETSLPKSGTTIERLRRQLFSVVKTYRGELARLAADIIAEGQADPEVLKLFRDHFVTPRREATRAVIEAGIANGELDSSLDPELALDLLYGPVYFRLLIAHAPLDDNFARRHWDRASRALLPSKATTTSKPVRLSVRRDKHRVSGSTSS